MTDHRADDPVPIDGLIDRVLGRLPRADVAPVVRLRLDWDRIAGPWSTRCRPIALRGGVLTVVVVSGLEATRLRYEATGLAQRVDAALGAGGDVTRIAFRVATPAEQAAAASVSPPPSGEEWLQQGPQVGTADEEGGSPSPPSDGAPETAPAAYSVPRPELPSWPD